MSEVDHEAIADSVVSKLRAEKGFRGCPLSRDEQKAVKELAAVNSILQNIATAQKRFTKWGGLLLTAVIIVAAKDIYGFIISLWERLAG